MMQFVRKTGAFLLFATLILAFAIQFGGNFSFQRLGGHSYIAKVGSIEVTQQQYKNAYDRLIENISARAKQRISQAQAKAFGLPQQALQGLIQESLLNSEANQLGLGLSIDGLGKIIRGNPAFQDASGNFDAEKYRFFLQQRGYSESYFQHELSQDIVRQQIQGIFATSGVVPATMLDAYNRYLNELRTISYFSLEPKAAGTIETPSEEAQKSFYDDHKTQFMAPEFRKVAALAVTPQTVSASITIPDEEVKAKYDSQPANYAVPERRKISFVPFKTKAAAEAAEAELNAGKSFDDVAKAAGFQSSDTSLGSVSKAELGEKFDSNQAILDAAFSLKKGKSSKPIDGPLSWVILRVDDIVAGKEESFDTVKAAIRESILKAKSTEASSKLIKQIEEERAAGLPLQDIAKKLSLKIDELTLDRKGDGMDGKPVQASAPAATIADGAFKSDPGVENEALRLPGGGYAWYDVLDVVKARQKPFDEVKAEAEAGWKKEQVRARLAAKARELVEHLSRGDKIADVAKGVGATAKTTQPMKRDGTEAGLPQSAIAQAFSLAEGDAGSAQGSDGESRAVFQLTKVTEPGPLNAMQSKTLEQRLSSQIAEDNFAQYLTGAEKATGVTIDRKNFAAVAGGGSVDEGE
jgi:peptidyl-prolyl cis-trans isomerase D